MASGESKEPNRLGVWIAWLRMWTFEPVKLLIGVGYVAIITEGLRMVVPALGIKLYRLPLLSFLRNYEVWHKLDLALFAGILLFALSNWIWKVLLETWLYDKSGLDSAGRNASKYERCLLVLGSIILFSDACLFYRAMTFVGWGGQVISPTALLCTAAYLAVLVAVCAVSVNLKRNYLFLKQGREKERKHVSADIYSLLPGAGRLPATGNGRSGV
jgi:hypothetical protein